MKKNGIALMVLDDLKKRGGHESAKDDESAKGSACDDVMQALKDEDSEAFESALKSVIKQVIAESEE